MRKTWTNTHQNTVLFDSHGQCTPTVPKTPRPRHTHTSSLAHATIPPDLTPLFPTSLRQAHSHAHVLTFSTFSCPLISLPLSITLVSSFHISFKRTLAHTHTHTYTPWIYFRRPNRSRSGISMTVLSSPELLLAPAGPTPSSAPPNAILMILVA